MNKIPMAEKREDRIKREKKQRSSLLWAKMFFLLIVLAIIFASCTA